jgi:FkbM family methyltransferase
MLDDLIFDVGMHEGRDTEFYLKKGFRVIAVEADADFIAPVKTRLFEYVSSGRLIIENIAIGESEGKITFYKNETKNDWGTTSLKFVARNTGRNAPHRPVVVYATTLDKLISKYGTPYYLKIDIEGSDYLCLSHLRKTLDRPKYVSIEASHDHFFNFFSEVSLMWELGYRKFKIVNQDLNKYVRCPNPPREGAFVDARFNGLTSGPFGEEAPGNWIGIEETILRYRKLIVDQQLFGPEGVVGKTFAGRLYRYFRKYIRRSPVGWYDLHGSLPAETASCLDGNQQVNNGT